jgi:hypothetical protein
MRWQQDWAEISNRIGGLVEMANLYARGLSSRQYVNDLPQTNKEILVSARNAYENVMKFRDRYESILLPLTLARVREFVNAFHSRFVQGDPERSAHGQALFDLALCSVIALAVFRSEFSLLLADTEAVARSLVDRALLHLQRSIVADESFAARWRRAFERGETACEQLGAVHLLSFGIYAFKANAAGERTDLVLGGSVLLEEAERAADTLVLTEWKKVSDAADLTTKAGQAFAQAKLYAAGSLAGFELSTRRYLVMLSAKRLQMPDDRTDGAVTYEFRNVAVVPDTPSRTG